MRNRSVDGDDEIERQDRRRGVGEIAQQRRQDLEPHTGGRVIGLRDGGAFLQCVEAQVRNRRERRQLRRRNADIRERQWRLRLWP